MNGPPMGPGGRPCPRGWVRWRGAVLPWWCWAGGRAPVLLPWRFRPGAALVPRLMAGPAGRLPHHAHPVKGRDKRPTVGLWAALDRPGVVW